MEGCSWEVILLNYSLCKVCNVAANFAETKSWYEEGTELVRSGSSPYRRTYQ